MIVKKEGKSSKYFWYHVLRKVGEAPHFITFDKLIPKKKFDSITILFKSYNKNGGWKWHAHQNKSCGVNWIDGKGVMTFESFGAVSTRSGILLFIAYYLD